MSFADCGINIRTGQKTDFNIDPQMVLCFVKLEKMYSGNNTLHESNSFLVTNIDPAINFKRYANLKLCSYKKIKSTSRDEKSIDYFFKKLTRNRTLNDSESKVEMMKSNEIWDLWTILPDFKESLLQSSLTYTETQRKKFEKEGNEHFKQLYDMANKMIKIHIEAIKTRDSKYYGELTIKYYNQMKQFESLAIKKEEEKVLKISQDGTKGTGGIILTTDQEKPTSNKEKPTTSTQITPTTEKISDFAFDVPSLPNELEFQKKILVFVGFLGLGYWAVSLLRNIARDKLEPVIDRFLSKIKSSRVISKKQRSSIEKILSEKLTQSEKRLSSVKQKSYKPKVSTSSSKRKYPRKITKKSKSVR